MNRAIFLLGGNSGDRFDNLFTSIREMIQVFGPATRSSSLYLTEPWGKKDQAWFVNLAIEFNSVYSPEETLEKTLKIENSLGRSRSEKWGPRTLDIDLLYHGDSIRSSEYLTLPHPGIPVRKFVLEPLTEMAPDHLHPLLKVTHAGLLSNFQGKEIVTRL